MKGSVTGRVMRNHDHTDHCDIGSAPGWNALIAIIATERRTPHRPVLNENTVLFWLFSSITATYRSSRCVGT